jgi:glycine/serine hydroxymethyltransferase
MQPDFKITRAQIVANAKVLAQTLAEEATASSPAAPTRT